MRQGSRTWWPNRLSTQVFVLLAGIVSLTVAAGFAMSYTQIRHELDAQAGAKSLDIAHAVAGMPSVAAALSRHHPETTIQPLMQTLRRQTGASFIVVADAHGIRYSHPNPNLIGTSLLNDPGEDPEAVLAGHTFVGVQSGSLGRSMRAKVPIRDSSGRVIGLVSVGVLEQTVSAEMRRDLPTTLVPPLLGLALGLVGAILLTRRIKRQTFGLEPPEIASLLEQREAILHAVREGTITVDTSGTVNLINDEAQRLLGLDRRAVGRPLAELVPEGRPREILAGPAPARDETILVDRRVLVVNRVPVAVRERPVGSVITLRDRTELETLTRELDDVQSLADALRAQEHEFANRMNVISGLIELERYDDAVRFINRNSQLHQDLAAHLMDQVGDPVLSALLLGKASVASERGVDFAVTAGTALPRGMTDPNGLVVIVGNLIDNALDSAHAGSGEARVEVDLWIADDELAIRVHDSGPGIPAAIASEIFTDGFTTKVASSRTRRRGLGLALVSQEVDRRGGRIEVGNDEGAVFMVRIPLAAILTADPMPPEAAVSG
jgi:two-component system CitB family sensor kinase